MACSYTKTEVSEIVVEVINKLEHREDISEESEFGSDIMADEFARELYFSPIKTNVEKEGCSLNNFSTSDCAQAKKVQDIVDAVWKDFSGEEA